MPNTIVQSTNQSTQSIVKWGSTGSRTFLFLDTGGMTKIVAEGKIRNPQDLLVINKNSNNQDRVGGSGNSGELLELIWWLSSRA
jgi:hypothetical protein